MHLIIDTAYPTSSRFVDLSGNEYGKLTVLHYAGKDRHRNIWYKCRCFCGNELFIRASGFTSGNTKSCCLRQVSQLKHGFYKDGITEPTYVCWLTMKHRCHDTNDPNYFRYGGRGITVCPEWLDSFENFLADMGPRPSNKHSLDRIDNNLGYSKDNCRWATAKEQARNMTTNHLITYKNQTKCLAEWAEEYGFNYSTFASRVRRGLEGAELFAPVK